jgi:hypothetical protein
MASRLRAGTQRKTRSLEARVFSLGGMDLPPRVEGGGKPMDRRTLRLLLYLLILVEIASVLAIAVSALP